MTSSFATTASYVNPLIQTVLVTGSLNTTGSATIIGPLTVTGSTIFSGSLKTIGATSLTGSLNVTGSTILSGSLTVMSNESAYTQATIQNLSNNAASGIDFNVYAGSGISGSGFSLEMTPKGNTVNTYFAGGLNLGIYPINGAGDANRPMKFITSILAAPATNNSFEWHYNGSFSLGASTLKMKLDVPSGILSNSGSIVTSGSLTISSGSANTKNDCAVYLGASGSAGSWRIAPSGSNLVIQRWNGTFYSQSGIFS
jgi:hypothetical protein